MKMKEKKVSDLLLIHMCFCESLGVTWGIVNVCFTLRQGKLPFTVLDLLGEVVIYASVYQTLICITLDRFLAVKLNFRYRSIVTKYRLCVLIPVIWVVSALLGTLLALTNFKVYFVTWNVLDACTVTTLLVSYTYIIMTVHKQKRIFKLNSSCRSQFKYQIPLCICLTYLAFIFIPNLTLSIKSDLHGLWFMVVYSVNYCCDPLIYVLFSQYEKRRKRKLVKNSRTTDSQKSEGVTERWL